LLLIASKRFILTCLAVVIRSILFFMSVPLMFMPLFVALFLILYSVLTVCQTNSEGIWFIFTVYSLFAVKCVISFVSFKAIVYTFR
jgi:hypothetical protein